MKEFFETAFEFVKFLIPHYSHEFIAVMGNFEDGFAMYKPVIMLEEDEEAPDGVALMSVFKWLSFWRVKNQEGIVISWEYYLELCEREE